MGKVLDISYEIWNRKLFSLPKILLLPGVMSRQPMLVIQVFPIIVASDWIKAAVMSAMTRKVEDLEKELQDLRAVRSKVEAFDIKNAELLQRSGSGATRFTQRRWEDLTVKVQARIVVSDLINRSKLFFSFIQRNFIFSVLIDCALANLIAIGKIVSADTFVFSRAIEDTVDMLLMRSRAEAELARMKTEIEKLDQLAETWERSKNRSLLHCLVSGAPSVTSVPLTSPSLVQHRKNTVVLRNLVYSRGTAHVRADHIELDAGVYALTGSNGSGKSTLFRILMSCHTNEKPIDLPASINMLTPMQPLCEEDDVRRETTCVADGTDLVPDEDDVIVPQPVDSVEIDASGSVIRALESAPQQPVEQGPAPPVPHPKLSISLPSRHVVEISQSFYWPLYARPIDWIYQDEKLEGLSADQLALKARRVAEELRNLEFFQSAILSSSRDDGPDTEVDPEEAMLQRIVSELLETKEDWFSDLSGGQKSKVELVRKVFLHDRCPDVLLIDETMAPLDPSSKALVMGKIKDFCSHSIVIVIYHTDVGRETTDEGGKAVECVPSNEFFNKNIHLEAGVVHIRSVC
jgi:energy-coupling factor transporter ATP-binding protein EcfA2